MTESQILYGRGDATFHAVGGEAGVRALVDKFYDIMAAKKDYQTLWNWHPDDNQKSRDKLFYFLCMWMGGPADYVKYFGPINIPAAHKHLRVTRKERDQWLNCMYEAMQVLNFSNTLSEYLIRQLSIPAERIRLTSRG